MTSYCVAVPSLADTCFLRKDRRKMANSSSSTFDTCRISLLSFSRSVGLQGCTVYPKFHLHPQVEVHNTPHCTDTFFSGQSILPTPDLDQLHTSTSTDPRTSYQGMETEGTHRIPRDYRFHRTALDRPQVARTLPQEIQLP